MIYLSLGSNIGDRMGHLAGGVAALRAIDGGGVVTVAAFSPVYETAPLGADGAVVSDQEPFLNAALAIETALAPAALRERTVAIETRHGRRAGERWQPRTLDIDIVLWGDRRVDTPTLTIPHPRMLERAFVVQPLLDLDPALVVPGAGRLDAFVAAVAGQPCIRIATAREFETRAGEAGR